MLPTSHLLAIQQPSNRKPLERLIKCRFVGKLSHTLYQLRYEASLISRVIRFLPALLLHPESCNVQDPSTHPPIYLPTNPSIHKTISRNFEMLQCHGSLMIPGQQSEVARIGTSLRAYTVFSVRDFRFRQSIYWSSEETYKFKAVFAVCVHNTSMQPTIHPSINP